MKKCLMGISVSEARKKQEATIIITLFGSVGAGSLGAWGGFAALSSGAMII